MQMEQTVMSGAFSGSKEFDPEYFNTTCSTNAGT